MNDISTSFTNMLPSAEAMLVGGGLVFVLVVLLCLGLYIAGRRKGQREVATAAMAMSNREYRRLKRELR